MNRLTKAIRVLLGKPEQKRMYAAARPSRLTAGWQISTGTADAQIRESLTNLRGRSRALTRDSAYAKRAKVIVVNNVIGSGIGLQAQVRTSRDGLNQRVNDSIEAAWGRWSEGQYCHTGGTLHFADFERALMGEVFETGEAFVRLHFRSFGASPVPLAMELIESERVPHDDLYASQPATGAESRMGIEVDKFYRPIAYWIRDRHPSDYQYPSTLGSETITRVPAAEILHLRVVDRWPQSRGVPWLHAAAKSLNDMDGYTDAEITAARGAANYMAWIEQSDLDDPDAEQQGDGSYQTELTPGIIGRGPPGSKIEFLSPNRPNAALDPFMRYMVRQVAASIPGMTYESLSVDYSQSNYSSSRLALLDSRDAWKALQQWFIRDFRHRVHGWWMQQAVFAGAIPGVSADEYMRDPDKYRSVKYKPRGWSWVDPTKEVEAYKEAEMAGYLTKTQIISMTNGNMDIEDVFEERRQELDAANELGLEFSTDATPEAKQAVAMETEEDDEEMRPMRVVK